MSRPRVMQAVAGYALSDMRADWIVTVLTIALYGLLLTPVLILYVVKSGVIEAWAKDLSQDNRNREVTIIGEYSISLESLDRLRGLANVDYLVPEPTGVIREMRVRQITPERGKREWVKVRTTSPGDPAFPAEAVVPSGFQEVALSVPAAVALGEAAGKPMATGDRVMIEVRRDKKNGGGQERQRPELTVVSIVPENRWSGGGMFISTDLARAIREYRQHEIDPGPDWPDKVHRPDAPWQSIRIYATTVRDAVDLSQSLSKFTDADGRFLETAVNTDQILNMVQLEDGLSQIFNVIVALSAVGFGATAFLTQWVSVSRKRRDLALMVMTGFRRRDVWIFPMTQAAGATFGGAALSLLALAVASPMIDGFVATYSREGAFELPPPWHLLAAFAVALAIVIVASWAAVQQIRDLDIAASLRSD